MTGAQILELLNQSATLFKGAIQPSGIRYKFYRYSDALPGPQPYAWGAFDAEVYNKVTQAWEPLDLETTYRVGTNEFLAPAGQDGFVPFKYMTNISYWGDMLDSVNAWVTANYTFANPYKGPNGDGTLDGRITRDGDDASGSIIPITFLHHNDSHGNLVKGTYVGYTQLATLIKQERAHNPSRTLLVNAGDSIQGDSMMYYFKSAGLGYTADGTPLPPALMINPLIKAFNSMDYDAMTLGNHEFNFGHEIFTSSLKLADFPLLQANVADTGEYGLDEVPIVPYVEKTVGPESVRVAILGIGNHRVPNYELPSNIPGLTFSNPISKTQELSDQLRASNDIVLALTHIGFTENPGSVEIDTNVDTNLAKIVSGVDLIIGGHSHTNPATGFGPYKYLPTIVGGPSNTPVLINHAYRYNNTLGEVVIGVKANTAEGFGYDVVSRAGRYISVSSSTTEDPAVKALIDPYTTLLQAYNNTDVGLTTAPIDALQAYTQETTGANIQADASVWELESHHGVPVDFHLSGAMSNRKVADGATTGSPVMLKVSDMFTLMPYENSLVVMEMNGPQLKKVLERAYRNYYYYKYVPGYGGYSYYTTCMIDINHGGQITYRDGHPNLPNGNNVESLVVNGQAIDFDDASTYYRVSTVNYLAAGSCNFNDSGATLWPLNQIVNDTQFYVRDAMINYITDQTIVTPTIEGRLAFNGGAYLEVGHLAPFAAGAGTAVTVTVNSTPVLTDFVFAESTGYLSVPTGTLSVAVYPAGSSTPAISTTVTLADGMDYTAIAVGDGANQPLDLLALEDDNSAPAAGNFKLRLGHLAPFADTITGTLADIRLQDGTPVITNVPFGAVAPYLELPAGAYDLKITTPGGAVTLIDPLPVPFNAGDIVSAFAVGEGVNQPLGVFAWPAGVPGSLLPLAQPVSYKVFLPLVMKGYIVP
jgi:5'-nucleotidase